MLIKNVRHTGIVVQNLRKTLNFFTKELGFKVIKKQLETGQFIEKILKLKKVKVTTVKLATNDGSLIELLKFHNYSKNEIKKRIFSLGITHVSFTVSNIQKLIKVLKKNKIEILSNPATSPNKKVKVVFCKFSDSIFFEFVEEL